MDEEYKNMEDVCVRVDRIDGMVMMMLSVSQRIIPPISTSFIRRRILCLDDDKPKFKYGKMNPKFKYGRGYITDYYLHPKDLIDSRYRIHFPIINRIFARTLAQDIVPVQAMPMPDFIRFRYDYFDLDSINTQKSKFKYGK